MAGFRQIAKNKQRAIDDLDDIIARLVLTVQESMRRKILREIIPSLTLTGDKLSNSVANQKRVNEVQDVFQKWAAKDGRRLADTIAKSVVATSYISEKYYHETLNEPSISKSDIKRAVGIGLAGIVSRYGISISNRGSVRAKPSGSIMSAIMNEAMVRTLQSVIQKSILTGDTIKNLKGNIGTILGRGANSGILERNINESFPNPALIADRDLNVQVSQKLQLNFAFYQGGTIETTRDFCDVRNNKVFSREEIAKFGTSQDEYGGYTNKSAGEFQGKTKTYNPFVDLGGYNCRHSLDWISDDLAKTFRPELFPNE